MFKSYKSISVPIDIDGKTYQKVITDITTNVRIQQSYVDNVSNYELKTLQDGETYEIASYYHYNNPEYNHLVMLANQQYDWRTNSPLTQAQLDSMINEKYVHPDNVHHYEDGYGNIVENFAGQFVIPITNREYEIRLNDQKRHIQMIKQSEARRINDALESMV